MKPKHEAYMIVDGRGRLVGVGREVDDAIADAHDTMRKACVDIPESELKTMWCTQALADALKGGLTTWQEVEGVYCTEDEYDAWRDANADLFR